MQLMERKNNRQHRFLNSNLDIEAKEQPNVPDTAIKILPGLLRDTFMYSTMNSSTF